MPDNPASAFNKQLEENIRDPAIRSMVGALLDGASAALKDLASLDESIFNRMMDSGVRLRALDPKALYPQLFESTFSGVRKLLAYAEQAWLLDGGTKDEPAGDLDFDFPMEEAPAGAGTPRSDARLALNDIDIEGVVDSIIPEAPADEFGKFAQLRSHVTAIDYALKGQMDGFRARLNEALAAGYSSELMAQLDDARNAASDGLFALVTAICQTFLTTVEPTTLLPEYKSQLQRALLARWSLAQLTREVEAENRVIQQPDATPEHADGAYQRLTQILDRYIKGQAFKAMRPSDRWEFINFQRLLTGKTVVQARQTCEGLSKYLESLGSINQREVLIQHDTEVIKEVNELVGAAQSLVAISVSGAGNLVRQALQLAGKLYGRGRELDDLLNEIGLTPPALGNAEEIGRFIQRIQETVGRRAG